MSFYGQAIGFQVEAPAEVAAPAVPFVAGPALGDAIPVPTIGYAPEATVCGAGSSGNYYVPKADDPSGETFASLTVGTPDTTGLSIQLVPNAPDGNDIAFLNGNAKAIIQLDPSTNWLQLLDADTREGLRITDTGDCVVDRVLHVGGNLDVSGIGIFPSYCSATAFDSRRNIFPLAVSVPDSAATTLLPIPQLNVPMSTQCYRFIVGVDASGAWTGRTFLCDVCVMWNSGGGAVYTIEYSSSMPSGWSFSISGSAPANLQLTQTSGGPLMVYPSYITFGANSTS